MEGESKGRMAFMCLIFGMVVTEIGHGECSFDFAACGSRSLFTRVLFHEHHLNCGRGERVVRVLVNESDELGYQSKC